MMFRSYLGFREGVIIKFPQTVNKVDRRKNTARIFSEGLQLMFRELFHSSQFFGAHASDQIRIGFY